MASTLWAASAGRVWQSARLVTHAAQIWGASDCCRALKVLLVCLQCEGVGKDSIPGAINFDIINDMIQVTDKQSFLVSRPALHLS